MKALALLVLASGFFNIGVVFLWLALTLGRMKKVKPTGQGMVFRNGRFEVFDRFTSDDIRRAMGTTQNVRPRRYMRY